MRAGCCWRSTRPDWACRLTLVTGLAFGRLTTAFTWVKRHFTALTVASALSLAFLGVLLTLNRLTWITSQLQTALGHAGLRGLVSLG